MGNIRDFREVRGLEEAVRLYANDRACPYRVQAEEVCRALREAAARIPGKVAVELTDGGALPANLRGKHIPAITTVRVTPMRDHRFAERAVTVYVSAEDIRRETRRRGRPFPWCEMWAGDFLAYVGEHELSARFVSGRAKFNLLWLQLNFTREQADRIRWEERELRERERPVLRAAYEKELARVEALEAEGLGNRFFRPFFEVIAAVNADLPDARRAAWAVSALVAHSLFSDNHLLVEEEEAPVRGRRRVPKTGRVVTDGAETDALIVYTTDEIPASELRENGRVILYGAYDAFALLELFHAKKLPVKLVSTESELIIPYAALEEGYQAA